MNAPATYSQTWDLDSLAPNPDSDAFGELLGSYRDDLSGLANQADSLAPLGDPDPEVLNAWEQFLE